MPAEGLKHQVPWLRNPDVAGEWVMTLGRRAFLQRTGWALAGLGLSELRLASLGSQYQQVLAQPTRRKLALLVGINAYSTQSQMPALKGCLTDVELQRQLLIHRFGFQPQDVLVLTDQAATHDKIETAFVEHLIHQARPEDVVVFHFSGYGRHVLLEGTQQDTNVPMGYSEQNALIPVDGIVAKAESSSEAQVNALLEETLFLLLRSLATNQITTVLDAGYVYPETAMLGNLQVRSRPALEQGTLTRTELALQEKLLSQIDFSREQVEVQRRSRQMPGVLLSAAGATQLSLEANWQGFAAGLFTYALTQYLWSTTPPTSIWLSCSHAATELQQWVGQNQQPQLSGQQSRQNSLLPYDLVSRKGAEGVVTAVEESAQQAKLWLAGLPPQILSHYSPQSILRVLPLSGTAAATSGSGRIQASPTQSDAAAVKPDTDNSTSELAAGQGTKPQSKLQTKLQKQPQDREVKLRLQSLDGLTGKAELVGSGNLQPGQWVQEVIRVLPRQLRMSVALDAKLARIERVDATSAFSSLSRVAVVETGKPADYLFARAQINSPVQVNPSQDEDSPWHVLVSDPSQSQHSYGLFFLSRELLPNTLGEAGESVKAAIRRLAPKLKALLAAKLLGLTVNESSSGLGVSATLETTAPTAEVLSRQQTQRAPWSAPQADTDFLPKDEKEGTPITVPIGSRIQYRIHNYSDRPVYLMLLGIDSSAGTSAYYSPAIQSDDPEGKLLLKNEVIAPGKALIVPHISNAFEWVIHGPSGLTTNYLLLSHKPFNKTLAMLEKEMRQSQTADIQQIATLPNLLDVVQQVLEDLNQASEAAAKAAEISADKFALDVANWATLRFTYRVI